MGDSRRNSCMVRVAELLGDMRSMHMVQRCRLEAGRSSLWCTHRGVAG